MTQQEIIIIKLDELRLQLKEENRPSATKICQEAIDYLSSQPQDKIADGWKDAKKDPPELSTAMDKMLKEIEEYFDAPNYKNNVVNYKSFYDGAYHYLKTLENILIMKSKLSN